MINKIIEEFTVVLVYDTLTHLAARCVVLKVTDPIKNKS